MALQKEISVMGLQLPSGYIQVTEVRMTRTHDKVLVITRRYTDASKENEIERSQADFHTFPYNPDATVAWAYVQLKQLPEFAGAVDV